MRNTVVNRGFGMSSVPVDQLVKKYESFRRRGGLVVEQIRPMLPALFEDGCPIPPATVEGMAYYKHKYVTLCEFAWPNRTAPVGAPTFEHFAARIAELSQAPATTTNDSVTQLQATAGGEAQLETIRARLQAVTDDERDQVQQAEASLMRLITEGDRLTDQEWQELSEQVGTVFGRDIALAAARGKFFVPKEPPASGGASAP